MNITIKVEADELVQAILQLAESMKNNQPAESPTPAEKPKAKRAKPEAPAPVEEPTVESPAPKPVTLEVVRARLGELSSDGKKEEIKGLFAKFGVAKLTELQPEKFGELLAAAEAL
jgi:hypothetical protein